MKPIAAVDLRMVDICHFLVMSVDVDVIPHKHIFGSWSELMEYVYHINEDEEVDHLNRWRFFDWDKVYGTLINE